MKTTTKFTAGMAGVNIPHVVVAANGRRGRVIGYRVPSYVFPYRLTAAGVMELKSSARDGQEGT